jgi:sec-independent protein translocase protein TatA
MASAQLNAVWQQPSRFRRRWLTLITGQSRGDLCKCEQLFCVIAPHSILLASYSSTIETCLIERGLVMLDNLLTPSHLAVILGVAVLFFGGKKIPKLGRGIGEGFRAFRDGIKSVTEEDEPTNKAS